MTKAISFFCSASIPFAILIIFLSALSKRAKIFDCFCVGAKEGLKTALSIIAPVCALMVAIEMLRSSGFLDIVANILAPITQFIGLDENLLPLALLRPISGSGSIGIVSGIVSHFGADSVISKTACVMAGSTETTFYTLAVYFGSLGARNTRHTLSAALLADLASVLISLIVCRYFFSTL